LEAAEAVRPHDHAAARSTVAPLTAQDLAALGAGAGLGAARVGMSRFTERVIGLSMGRAELITTSADKGSQFAISGFLVYYFCYGMIGLSAFMLGLNGGHHRLLVRTAIIVGALLPVSATLLVDLFFATRSNAHPVAIDVTGDCDQDVASAKERVRAPVGPRVRSWLVGRLVWAVMVGFVISLPVGNFFFGHDVAQQHNQDAYNTYKAENARQDARYLRDEANARQDVNAISAQSEALQGKAAAAVDQRVGALAGLGPSGQRLAVGQGPVESGLGQLATYYEQQAKQYLVSKQSELKQAQASINNDQTAIAELNQKNRSLAQATSGGLDDDAAIWEYLGNHPSQIPVYVVITLTMVLLDCGVVILKMLTHNSTYARTVAWEEIKINYLRATSTMTMIERSLEDAADAKAITDLHRTLRSHAMRDKENDPAAKRLYQQLVDAELRQRIHPMLNLPRQATPTSQPEPTAARDARRPAAGIRVDPADEPPASTDSESSHPLMRPRRELNDTVQELTNKTAQTRNHAPEPASAPTHIVSSRARADETFAADREADAIARRSAGASSHDPGAAPGARAGTAGAPDRRISRPYRKPGRPRRRIAPRPSLGQETQDDNAHNERDLDATKPPNPTDRATPPPARLPASPSLPSANGRSPRHGEISTRAYFISRGQDGHDDVGNWLRAEQELAPGEHPAAERSVPEPTPDRGEIEL
jgi:hypothetical protein